jgi:hypothetical protein
MAAVDASGQASRQSCPSLRIGSLRRQINSEGRNTMADEVETKLVPENPKHNHILLIAPGTVAESSSSEPVNTPKPTPPPGALPPTDEERRYQAQSQYREKDLQYERKSLIVSIIGFATVIVSMCVNIWQITINTEQMRLNTLQSENVAKGLRVNVGHNLVSHVTDLDKVFIANPDLSQYFYGDNVKPPDKSSDQYPKVAATAEMFLDVADLAGTQKRWFPEIFDTPGAWDEWIIDMFSSSPIIRTNFDSHERWYGDRLKDLRKQGQERLERRTQTGKTKSP